MSGTPGTELPGSTATLYEHALRLHRQSPDRPLRRDGEPYPDEERRQSAPRRKRSRGRKPAGAGVAGILDRHFADPDADPSRLAGRFQGVEVPIHPDEHITAAARRAGARGRAAGRRLVRYRTDREEVLVGLALLAAVGTAEDIPRVQTIGLLSCTFGPLAAHALERLPGGAQALLWLGDRVAGWGRVYVVEALCRLVDDDPAVRPWLLRRAVDGDFLNGYFAGKVAQAADLPAAMAEPDADAAVVAHTGRLLHVMSYCGGMGMTLAHYPQAAPVMRDHARRTAELGPSPERFLSAALLAGGLGEGADKASVGLAAEWEPLRLAYLALLDRDDWCAMARSAAAAGDGEMRWLSEEAPPGVELRAFRGWSPPTEEPPERDG